MDHYIPAYMLSEMLSSSNANPAKILELLDEQIGLRETEAGLLKAMLEKRKQQYATDASPVSRL